MQNRHRVLALVLAWCALTLSLPAQSEVPPAGVEIHAVMYEFTYELRSLVITHAQVVGGYASVELCRQAMPAVLATVAPQLGAQERARLQCSGITAGDPGDAESSGHGSSAAAL